ncbi:hypothetical protein CONCODRAFT_67933 [Conidiobolus coronatus NRRL 28638]|uniref:Uncharacterized protein n=1 Tax=Conidiobolus coronatus (strain ATCC 28846 / CBS 209.66 / NRRL 28638) TaxID=796925 RepID=A0A137PFT4_CONC2|nr:hypothetical protein CONCODRAFT_67933 [Conidiobolus coronatus NRRL 28638]|eukprot:KXN73866.1 hypothetical protein CONCODRAFT_67933 [Conidiobolus coronatus NRRL 28638]
MDLPTHKKHKSQTRQLKNYRDKLEKYEVFKSIWNKTFESQIEMIKKLIENLENLLKLSSEFLDKIDEIRPNIIYQNTELNDIEQMPQVSQNSDYTTDELNKSNWNASYDLAEKTHA